MRHKNANRLGFFPTPFNYICILYLPMPFSALNTLLNRPGKSYLDESVYGISLSLSLPIVIYASSWFDHLLLHNEAKVANKCTNNHATSYIPHLDFKTWFPRSKICRTYFFLYLCSSICTCHQNLNSALQNWKVR